MKSKKYFLLICSGIYLFLSCTSSSTKYIKPEYMKKSQKDAQLLMAPILEVAFNLTDEIKKELNITSTEQEHADFFKNNLVHNLKQQIQGQIFLATVYPDDQTFSTHKLSVKNAYFQMDIPDSTTWINNEIFTDGYILFLEGINFYISKTDKDSSRPEDFYEISGRKVNEATWHPMRYYKYYLHYDLKYAIMDHSMQIFVAYGKINLKKTIKEKVELELTASECVQKITEEILKSTPYVN